jgi:Amidase
VGVTLVSVGRGLLSHPMGWTSCWARFWTGRAQQIRWEQHNNPAGGWLGRLNAAAGHSLLKARLQSRKKSSGRGERCEWFTSPGNETFEDGPLVKRLRDAGAIILRKTNTSQLLIYIESDNGLYGRSNNPWNLDRTPGGSRW